MLPALCAPGLLAADTASVSGVVLNDATGAPLHMAVVTISTAGPKPLDATTFTDGKGAFSFEVPPGHYYLDARHPAYLRTWFGAPTGDIAPAVMTLQAGESRQGISLRLPPMAAISGVVVDPDNDPIPNARVRLLSSSFVHGKPGFSARNGATTNDRGEFRIHGIAPGRHYLEVMATQRATASGGRSEVSIGDPPPDLMWVSTWYSGVTSAADATALDVRGGADIRNIVLRMMTQEPAWVSGTVELPEGVSAASGITVHFMSEDEFGGSSMSRFGVGSSEGNQIPTQRLTPGRYKITATLQGSDEYRGSEEIEIHPGRQEITVRLGKPGRLAGHLSIEGAGGDLSKTEVALSPRDRTMPHLNTAVRADGSFEFPAVDAGIWDIDVQPVPKGGYIKSMLLGDQDVLTTEMVIGPQTTAPLNIVVSARGATVKGTLKQPDDGLASLTGVPRARVLLAPAGRFADVLSFFHYTNSDENGKFALHGIAPGSYKIFALDRLKPQAWWDPAFMKRIDALGKPLEIHEGEQVSVDLDMKPLPPDSEEK